MKPSIYYNEFNPESAIMLRQLMKDGIISMGDVDERSITEVKADEIKRYTQCHFFAGIGGWSIALRMAGWPENKPVWTGSCPCQPFSSAGRQKGKQDERHLLPTCLIEECNPSTIFGEQVSSAIAHGWLDDVFQGLEAQGYAVGSAVLPACSVGAPHKRDRLWFVGHAQYDGQPTPKEFRGDEQAISNNAQRQNSSSESERTSSPCDVANTECERPSGQGKLRESLCPKANNQGQTNRANDDSTRNWQNGQWVNCPDGKQRLIEPSICLLADGVQFRKSILHAFGNAIVPQVASEFIKAAIAAMQKAEPNGDN